MTVTKSECFNNPTDDETLMWWEYRRTASQNSRDKLIEKFRPWAQAKTCRFATIRRLDWQELWGVVALALIGAVERFDPACGVPFMGFASRRINGALFDALREMYGRPMRKRTVEDEARSGLPSGSFTPPEEVPTLPSSTPFAKACDKELETLVLNAMPKGRVREMAHRRIFLGQTIDEIGLAMHLGKSQTRDIIAIEILPRARRLIRSIGIRPSRQQLSKSRNRNLRN